MMPADQEILKTFNCLLFNADLNWPIVEIELPTNRTQGLYVNRVVEALQEVHFTAAPDVQVHLYKPLQPLKIETTQTPEWQARTRKSRDTTLHRIRPRQCLSAHFKDAPLNLDNEVHLVVFASWATVVINYLLFRSKDSVRSIRFPVNLQIQDCSDRIVGDLQRKGVIAHVESVALYQAPTGLAVNTARTSEWRESYSDPAAHSEPMLPSIALNKAFSLEELNSPSTLHLILKAEALKEETDRVAPLSEFCWTRYRKFADDYTENAKSPSAAAKSSEFRKNQQKQVPIYDGRRAPSAARNSSTIAMPPSLYHPVFQRWKKNAFDLSVKPSERLVRAAAELMRKATILYETEAQRTIALSGALQCLLGQHIEIVVNTDRTVPDRSITFQLKRDGMIYNVPLLIDEERRGATEGADATTQATFSAIRAWFDQKLDNLCDLTCCPTFLMGFSGCQLTISALVLPDKCIVQRLATLWVGRSSTFDQNHIMEMARVFHALSTALDELKEWYQSEVIVNRPLYDKHNNVPYNHPRFFPYANRYPPPTKDFRDAIKFEYLYPLESSSLCVTFLARATANQSDTFVVKFTQQYCEALHRLLAGKGLAPALRYCGEIDESTPYENWQMVVMDDFDGAQAAEGQALRNDVLEAIKVGHNAGFVFGDIRRPNVLVGKADGKVKLIDFDWAGEKDTARYPPDMSDNDDLWADGMVPMAAITEEHDLAMIDKWFPN